MPAELDSLPIELLQRILGYVAADSTSQAVAELSLVSRKFADIAHLHTIRLRSAKSADSFAGIVAASQSAAGRVRRLKVDADEYASPPESKTRRGKRGSVISVDQVARICEGLRCLEVLVLHSVDLSALRRRQLTFASTLAQLHTLAVASPPPGKGAAKAPHLNLHSLGMLVSALPTLRHLFVRGVRGSSASLRALPPPACGLVSLALLDLVDVTSAHLAWLLASTTQEDSLRQLTFELPESARPSQWSAIKWALLPVKKVYVTSPNLNAIETLPQHFPSLEAYHFRTTTPIDLDHLMASLPVKRQTRLYDYSSAAGGTNHLQSILQGSPKRRPSREREPSSNVPASPVSHSEPVLGPSHSSLKRMRPTCPNCAAGKSAVLSWEPPPWQDEPIVPNRFADLLYS